MALITISRQVAALGDEIATALSKKLGYTFIDRKQIESRIIELGFPKEKLPKYDEKKPGFFASLTKNRDEYLNYLQLAVIEASSKNNCILIGRGACVMLEDIPNHLGLRFVANDEVRIQRLMKEFSWNEKQARDRITESDENRKGFHKSFFNLDSENPQNYQMTLNTGILTESEAVKIIETLVKLKSSPELEAASKEKLGTLLKAQQLVNQLLFDYKMPIHYLKATVDKDEITLHGIADSQAVVEKAISQAARILPSLKMKSAISIAGKF